METEGFAIYDALMQLQNEVNFCSFHFLCLDKKCFIWMSQILLSLFNSESLLFLCLWYSLITW